MKRLAIALFGWVPLGVSQSIAEGHNDIDMILRDSTDQAERRAAWDASKEIGPKAAVQVRGTGVERTLDGRQEFGELAQSGDRPVCRQPIDEAMRADIVECRHSSAISVSAYCACALAGSSS